MRAARGISPQRDCRRLKFSAEKSRKSQSSPQGGRGCSVSLHGENSHEAFLSGESFRRWRSSPRRVPRAGISLRGEISGSAKLSAESSRRRRFSLRRDQVEGVSLRREISPDHFSPRRDLAEGASLCGEIWPWVFLSAERSPARHFSPRRTRQTPVRTRVSAARRSRNPGLEPISDAPAGFDCASAQRNWADCAEAQLVARRIGPKRNRLESLTFNLEFEVA